MESALHVGGGIGMQSQTDAAVLRHADGRPFIPGSSMKGVLRSHLERLLQAPVFRKDPATVRSCGLYAGLDERCPSPSWIAEKKDATRATEQDFENLCHTCTLFGSPILAGKVRIPDMELADEMWTGTFEIRDGVGIDRDSGLAAEGVLYDFEVVPSGTTFHFEWIVDSPDPVELGLMAVAVRELQNGYVAIGGKTTRGLGACRLEHIEITDQDLSILEGLRQVLLDRQAGRVADVDTWLDQHIENLFQ